VIFYPVRPDRRNVVALFHLFLYYLFVLCTSCTNKDIILISTLILADVNTPSLHSEFSLLNVSRIINANININNEPDRWFARAPSVTTVDRLVSLVGRFGQNHFARSDRDKRTS